jgi:hypothetical protein
LLSHSINEGGGGSGDGGDDGDDEDDDDDDDDEDDDDDDDDNGDADDDNGREYVKGKRQLNHSLTRKHQGIALSLIM